MHVEFSRVELYKKKNACRKLCSNLNLFLSYMEYSFLGGSISRIHYKKKLCQTPTVGTSRKFCKSHVFFLCLPVKLHFVTLSTMVPAQESLRPKTKILRGLFISKYHLNDIYFIFYIIIFFISNLLLILTN